jgi:uncharacterized protein (DUF2147 family)
MADITGVRLAGSQSQPPRGKRRIEMDKAEKRKRQRERATQNQRRNRIVMLVVALMVVAGAGWLVKAKFFGAQSKSGARANQPAAAKLVGRWMRPDGGYVLEIQQAEENGRLDVAYFNPRPIHVAQANLSQGNGQWHVFVKLRDVNYPGATYRLTYQPDRDQLAGEYHQPLVGQTFEVAFVRASNQSPAP